MKLPSPAQLIARIFSLAVANLLPAVFVVGLGLLPSPAAAQEPYRLNTGDILQITLLERPTVSGPYTIGVDGLISVPGLGTIKASGETLRSFEKRLKALAEKTIVEPSISAQVVQYRPFYILGDVRDSGKYPFVPGLTVMQAVAVAKGFGRRVEGGNALTRKLANLRAQQALDLNMVEMTGLQVRLARLVAEQAGESRFSYTPKAPAGVDRATLDSLVAEQTRLFQERRDAFAKQVDLSQRTLDARRKETASYASRIETQNGILDSYAAELAQTRKLREQGLVSSARLNDLLRNEMSTRGQILQTRSLMRQAQTAESRSEQELNGLISGHSLELVQNIQATSEQIEQLQARIDGELAILSETGGGRTAGPADPGHRFELYRNGTLTEAQVTLSTALAPGDTLFVIRKRLSEATN